MRKSDPYQADTIHNVSFLFSFFLNFDFFPTFSSCYETLTCQLSNDAVVPIDKSYEGCGSNKDGMCAFDTVVAALQKRIAEIDYDYDCHGD